MRNKTLKSDNVIKKILTINTKKHYFDNQEYLYSVDKNGLFGDFGGQFVPDDIKAELDTIYAKFKELQKDENFLNELYALMVDYVGRKSPLYFAKRLTNHFGKAKIYLKREDLNHTGAHKINNTLGQIFLAKKIGKKKIIAETGAGQHGVAVATVCALLDMPCEIYMGAVDIERQIANVRKIELLGGKVISAESGTKTLKEAVDEALQAYQKDLENSYYLIGSVVGPAPYPEMVRFFQSVIGNEIKEQIMEKENRLPDYVMACVGGGSNAMGTFYSFTGDENVKLIAVEAGGEGSNTDKTACTLEKGEEEVLHGFKSYVLKDKYGNIAEAYSISAGLDYPGVGPELGHLYKINRIESITITDKEAVEGFLLLSKLEGIIPAIESSHAIAGLSKMIDKTTEDEIIVVNISGRGDKDCERILKELK